MAGFRRRRKKRKNALYLYNQKQTINRYYIGMTADLNQRLRQHNSGANKSTKGGGPWSVIYKETFDNKKDAWQRERKIKKYKGGEAFKKLINQGEVA